MSELNSPATRNGSATPAGPDEPAGVGGDDAAVVDVAAAVDVDEDVDPEAEAAADDLDDEDAAPDDEDAEEDSEDEGDADRAGAKAADLFSETEIAADYVEGLLDILDYDGDIDQIVTNGRPMVEVVGGRLNALVGTRGATLEALQELARLAVFRQTGTPSRLLLDIGGFRAARRKELAAVAKNAAERVKQHGEPVRLEPMSAFERKCVHDVINALAGVESESEGVEPSRRIVVRPTP